MITKPEFIEMVARSYDFLVASNKFTRSVSDTDFCVVYLANEAFVEITYDHSRSYELGIWIGQDHGRGTAYYLSEVLDALECPKDEAKELQLVQTTDASTLDKAISKSADLLRRYGHRIWRGDSLLFSELEKSRSAASAAYTNQIALRQAISSAEAAWGRKDYSLVVSLLQPHSSFLTDATKRRLDYAKKMSR